MKILLVNTTAIGGPAIVVKKLQSQLLKNAQEVRLVSVENSRMGWLAKWTFLIEQMIVRVWDFDKSIFCSLSLFSIGIENEIKEFKPDIVHLHWINGGLLKPEDLINIKQPIVWTMHDMWPMCGLEHHASDDRYLNGYQKRGFFDLNWWVWKRKEWVYSKLSNITFVAPSRWLYSEAKKSWLLKDKKVVQISNGIDLSVFKPEDKALARKELNLDTNKKIILLGAAFAMGDKNKQMELVNEIIGGLACDYEVLIFGNGDKKMLKEVYPKIYKKIKYLGYVDNDKLKTVYSAADVFLVFSRHENLPTTIMESMACGTVPMAFDVGGISDFIDSDTGVLVRPFDVGEYNDKLAKLLENDTQRNIMAKKAVEKIKKIFDLKKIAKDYISLFEKVLDSSDAVK